MTAAQTSPDFVARLLAALRNGWTMAMKLVVGGLLVIAAGVIAVATAFVGLLLATAAVLFKVARGGRPMRRKTPSSASTEDAEFTLEARPTARGWTVE